MFKMFAGVFLIMAFAPDLVFNDGYYDLIEVTIPEGSVLRPTFPAPLGNRLSLMARQFDVVDAIFSKALEQFAVTGGYGTSPNFVYSGTDEDGNDYQILEILYGGIPARPFADGLDGHSWWPLFKAVPTEYLEKYYRQDIESGRCKSGLELNHVWPENYSVNSAQKVWAANFAAHHPNVVVLDLSSFKCGHDAPTYGMIDAIIETSKTPYAALHDIDANKPSGSIKIRVKTYAHALKLHEERLQDTRKRKGELLHAIDNKRIELLELRASQLSARQQQDPEILRQLEELRTKVAAYEAPQKVVEPAEVPKGLVTLGRKKADGSVQPIGAAT